MSRIHILIGFSRISYAFRMILSLPAKQIRIKRERDRNLASQFLLSQLILFNKSQLKDLILLYAVINRHVTTI
jgi:hypothetical protein